MPRSTHSILPLTVRNLHFEVGEARLIKDVNFTLSAGSRTAIVGANGAGKSLLLRLCHGLIRPTAGEVIWGGPAGDDPARHQAMVFQRPVMLRRSAAENIDHALADERFKLGEVFRCYGRCYGLSLWAMPRPVDFAEVTRFSPSSTM